MKESELVAKMNEISTHLKKTKILNTCLKFIDKYGNYYLGNDFSIKKDNNFVEENIVVKFDGRIVLHDRKFFSELEISPIDKYNPVIDNFYILRYHQGDWENKIKNVLKRGEKQVYKNVAKNHVDSLTFHRLKRNFNMLK